MFIGVAIMLILALNQVGGLSNATDKLSEMSPPKKGKVILRVELKSYSFQALTEYQPNAITLAPVVVVNGSIFHTQHS